MIAELMLGLLTRQQVRDLGYGPGRAPDAAPLIDERKLEHARLEFEPSAVEVGEPVDLVLTVPHGKSERVNVDQTALDGNLAWAVLEGPTRSTSFDAHGELATTRIAWKLAALEPGDAKSPEFDVRLARADEAPESVLVAAAELEVRGVLGANEDTPREPKGFREIVPEIAERPWWPWVVAGVVVVALAGAFVGRWLALRRRPRATPPPTTLERLEQLGRLNVDDPQVARDLHFELARALREHFDQGQNVRRPALTDEEWLRSVAGGLTPDRLRELGEILRTSELAKYGATQPTQWAVRETLERARKVASAGVVETPVGAAT